MKGLVHKNPVGKTTIFKGYDVVHTARHVGASVADHSHVAATMKSHRSANSLIIGGTATFSPSPYRSLVP
jgi:hypothetical protein